MTFHNIHCQCTGNLGENIFTDGDFGSGISNILLPDPQIAPGYTYESNPPPIDGTYSITNNTSSWGGFANPNWANISDNSSDPTGYMMIVNASYDPGLFYEQLVEDLCENTLYVFSVDIYNLAAGIKPNVSFLLDGVNVYTTGDIPLNNQWNTYEFSFSTQTGQNEITLALQNNAPGGDGNDLALDNISFRVCGPGALILPEGISNECTGNSSLELEASIIGNQFDNPQIQWQESTDGGITWTDIPGANALTYTHTDFSVGTYYYRYLLANAIVNLTSTKCRIISNEKIINIETQNIFITDTICDGLTYQVGNNFYSNTGSYIDSFTTIYGCDSIINLDLEVVPNNMSAQFLITDPSCEDFQDGSISIDNIMNGTEPFTIEIDEVIDTDGSISDLVHGDYNYSITDKFGCTFETDVNLNNPPNFNIDLGDDLLIELGETIEVIPFYSINPSNYNWNFVDSINCDDNCQTLNWAPPNSGILSLNAITENGCEAEDSIYIRVLKIRDVYIPNAFSPNADGYNDHFTVYASTPNVQQIDELIVFNRWGGIVHKSDSFLPNQIGIGWDGFHNGKQQAAGVYVYLAKIRFLDGEVLVYKGDISLIR